MAESTFASAMPKAYGGSLVPGSYALDAVSVYLGNPGETDAEAPANVGPTGNFVRATLTVAANGTLHVVSSRGQNQDALPADVGERFTYKVNGTALDLTPVCPQPGAARVIPFSANAGSITLQRDGKVQETFVRK